MTRCPSVYATCVVLGLIYLPINAMAQSATTGPQTKIIGTPSSSGLVPSLIVLNAHGATLGGQKLVLNGVALNTIIFADRPVRAAGHALTKDVVEEWKPEGGEFADDPPNATISAFSKDGSSVRDAVVVLKSPQLEGERLTFDVDVLEGDLAGVDGAASLFIDRFGFAYRGGGFARGGFAGVGRVGGGRVGVAGVGYGGGWARRGAWYGGAAVGAAAIGGAAIGAAAANAYSAPACGYYPNPPCY